MRKRPLCTVCIIFLAVQAVRICLAGAEISSALEKQAGISSQIVLQGSVYKIEEKNKVMAYYLKNNKAEIHNRSVNESKILVYIHKEQKSENIRIGNILRINGEMQLFEHARNPGNFDQKLYYMRQGIRVLVWAEQLEIISGKTDYLRQFLFEFKGKWNDLLIRYLGDYYGGTMSAVLLGERGGLDAEMKKMYQKNGISHLLAISGLHMSFIGMGLYCILRKIGLGFAPAGAAGGIILLLYSFMISAGVSSLRALIMFLIRMGAEITGRDYDLPTSLGFSASLLCLWQPLNLTDAGFILSFGAILGICLLNPIFEDVFQLKKEYRHTGMGKRRLTQRLHAILIKPAEWAVSGISTSLSVNILLLGPMLFFYFEVPPYSVLLNLIVIPIMPAAMGAGIFGSALAVFSETLGELTLKICAAVLGIYDALCEVSRILPASRVVTGKPGAAGLILYYLILAVLFTIAYFFRVKKRREEDTAIEKGKEVSHVWNKVCRIPGLCMILTAVILCGACKAKHQNPDGAEITVADVGQGDCIFIRSSHIACMIDGGSSDISSVGSYRIEPFLLSGAVDVLDYVFITHGDQDHVSGIAEMIENQKLGIRIRNLVVPPLQYHDETLMSLIKTAIKNDTKVLIMDRGDIVKDGKELLLSCLGPEITQDIMPGNEASLVIALKYAEFDMLFTGDVEGKGEDNLIKSDVLREYDVLKAAHHGSADSGSEEFLDITSPAYAVISAGVDNRYHHPSPKTIERLQKYGCTVYSTQDNGAVRITTNGKHMKFSGFLGLKQYVSESQ